MNALVFIPAVSINPASVPVSVASVPVSVASVPISVSSIPAAVIDAPVFFVLLILLAGSLVYMLWRFRELTARLRQLRKEKEVMHGFISDIGEAFNDDEQVEVEDLLRQVLFYALNTSKGSAGIIYLRTSDGSLEVQALSGVFPPMFALDRQAFEESSDPAGFLEKLNLERVLKPGETIIGEVSESGKHKIIEHAAEDPRLPDHRADLLRFHSVLVVPMRFRNNIMGVLAVVNPTDGTAFHQGDLSLLQVLADQASVSTYYASLKDTLLEKERIDRDLELATKIQKAMLPDALPDFDCVDISALSESARQIGGDFYDVFQVDEEHIGLAIADVSGKGIVGALVMAICRSILRVHAVENRSPAAVMRKVQASIQGDLPEDMFITMSYAVLNLETMELTFARAGHEPVLHFQAETGQVREVESPGVALGLMDDETFGAILQEDSIFLKKGDYASFYTDGVTEALDITGEEWGKKPLIAVLEAGKDKGAAQIVDEVRQQVLRFTGDMPQSDDITFVIIGAQ